MSASYMFCRKRGVVVPSPWRSLFCERSLCGSSAHGCSAQRKEKPDWIRWMSGLLAKWIRARAVVGLLGTPWIGDG